MKYNCPNSFICRKIDNNHPQNSKENINEFMIIKWCKKTVFNLQLVQVNDTQHINRS